MRRLFLKIHVKCLLLVVVVFALSLFVWQTGLRHSTNQDFRLLSYVNYSNVTPDGQLTCNCLRTANIMTTHSNPGAISACSSHATARGGRQKVVAYTFFGSIYEEYFEGAKTVVENVAKMYPGWTMRLYHNLTFGNIGQGDVLCHLWCHHPHLDLCDVRHLPFPLTDKSTICPTFWRFFVLGDPLIDRFLIRDMDSIILQREVDSVNVWIDSGHSWHVMRDFPNHDAAIMAGMWGGTNLNLSLTKSLRDELISQGDVPCNRTWDQDLLAEIVWPLIKSDMIAHDSYHCTKYEGSQAWPTQREDKQFVGDKFPWRGPTFIVPPCPIQCRPKNHSNWIYC